MITQSHMAIGVARSRAHDHLNPGFGFKFATSWLPVYAIFTIRTFGLASGKVYTEEGYK